MLKRIRRYLDKKYQEEFEMDLYQAMADVFTFMDRSQMGFVLKNLKHLTREQLLDLAEHAFDNIIETPNFNMQSMWLRDIMGSRNTIFQSGVIFAMIKHGGAIVNRTTIKNVEKGIYGIDSEYHYQGYSIAYQYFVDNVNKEAPSHCLFWTFFSMGVFDKTLTPSFLWRKMIEYIPIDEVQKNIEKSVSLKNIFKEILYDAKQNLNRKELNDLVKALDMNARKNGWEAELVLETRTLYSNIVNLH